MASMFDKNRKARQEVYQQVKTAATTHTAQRLVHDLGMLDGDNRRKVTAQTAPKEAIELVYGTVTNYVWPHPPKLSYSGLRRTDNRMAAKNLEHGVVTVTATVRTPIGVTLGIDIPVEIRNGHMLEPSVMFHNGIPHVISQSAINNIVRDNSAYGQIPTRRMFSGPHTQQEQMESAPMRTERRTPSMFSTRAAASGLREIIRSRGARGSLRQEVDNEDRGLLRQK